MNNVPLPVVVVDLALLLTGLELLLVVEAVFAIAAPSEEGVMIVESPVVLDNAAVAAWTLVLEASKVLSVDVIVSEEASADDEPSGTGLGRVIVGVLETTTIGAPVIVVAEL